MTRRTTTRLATVAVAVGVVALGVAIWLFATGGADWDAVLGAVVGLAAIGGGVLTLWKAPTGTPDETERSRD